MKDLVHEPGDDSRNDKNHEDLAKESWYFDIEEIDQDLFWDAQIIYASLKGEIKNKSFKHFEWFTEKTMNYIRDVKSNCASNGE